MDAGRLDESRPEGICRAANLSHSVLSRIGRGYMGLAKPVGYNNARGHHLSIDVCNA